MNIRLNNSLPQASVILVTGGTGFVGAYVIRDLVNAGYTVKAIRRNRAIPSFIDAEIFNPVEWIDGDVLDPAGLEEAMEGVDAVIHSAAVVSFHDNDKALMYGINIEGTANVINAAIEKNIKRFVHVSSVAAIGRKKNGGEVSEENKWEENKLNTPYAISKCRAEMEVWRGMAEGLNAVIVNPSTILGYGDWNSSSSSLFKNIYNGFSWYTNGHNGFVDVEDVSKAIVALLKSDISGERFILNGGNWTYRHLFNTIADEFGKKRPWREATPLLGEIAWRIDKLRSLLTGKRTMLTRQSAKIARSDTKFDNVKILNALPGFAFTPLEQTIKNACRRYLRSH